MPIGDIFSQVGGGKQPDIASILRGVSVGNGGGQNNAMTQMLPMLMQMMNGNKSTAPPNKPTEPLREDSPPREEKAAPSNAESNSSPNGMSPEDLLNYLRRKM